MKQTIRFRVAKRHGMALLLVVFVAFASLVLLTTLLASVAPRRATVSGELRADRALAIADGRIDLIMSTINTFPQVNVSGEAQENAAQAAIIATWEGMLNGYEYHPDSSSNAVGLSTYFYHATASTWYAVWNTTDNHLMSVPQTAKLGREVGATESTGNTVLALAVKNLSTNGFHAGGIISIDPNCRTNNEWFEVDSNARYNVTPTDVWTMRASAYLLSSPGVVRTLEARAEKGVDIDTTGTNYAWYTTVNRPMNFADYVFLDNFDVNFGRFAEVNGYVHANGTVNMGGWAKYPVSATDHVTDIAVDNANSRDGRFSDPKQSLTWAKATANGYAKEHAPEISWLEVDKALIGANPARAFGADTGMQDKAVDQYYVNGSATVTFSVESGVGKVTIKIGTGASNTYNMPGNGIIYVVGTATVKGTVEGSCMVGASGNINLGGDILYNTPPRTAEKSDFTPSRDFLGLVSAQNIFIPQSTYDLDRNLIVDAAMVADGWLGTDPDTWTSWHTLNTNPSTAPTLVVRGSMAAGSGEHMMVTTQTDHHGVTQIKGYDMRQYNFDWNLKQLGVPAGFPTTGSTTTAPVKMGVTEDNAATYGILWSQLTNPSLYPVGTPLSVGGRQFYAEATVATSTTTTSSTVWAGTGLVTNGMYRIGWKEQIGKSVDHPNP